MSFADREVETPLVPGLIRGIREFTLARDWEASGRATLKPIFAHFEYKDGENVAECDVQARSSMITSYGLSASRHPRVPDKMCSCGFYAYWENAAGRDHSTMGYYDKLVGIVEAYGKCLVGDQGFRSEKSRLVALVLPDLPEDRVVQDSWKARVGHKVRNFCVWGHNKLMSKRNIGLVMLMYIVPAFGLIALGLFGGIVKDITSWTLLALQFAFCACFVVSALGNWFVLQRTIASLDPSGRFTPEEDANRALRKSYPSAKFYPTIEEALEHHPAPLPEELV